MTDIHTHAQSVIASDGPDEEPAALVEAVTKAVDFGLYGGYYGKPKSIDRRAAVAAIAALRKWESTHGE